MYNAVSLPARRAVHTAAAYTACYGEWINDCARTGVALSCSKQHIGQTPPRAPSPPPHTHTFKTATIKTCWKKKRVCFHLSGNWLHYFVTPQLFRSIKPSLSHSLPYIEKHSTRPLSVICPFYFLYVITRIWFVERRHIWRQCLKRRAAHFPVHLARPT